MVLVYYCWSLWGGHYRMNHKRNNRRKEVWFWQVSPSPHMLPLLNAIIDRGYQVRCIITQPLSRYRMAQGWQCSTSEMQQILLEKVDNKKAILSHLKSAQPETVHVCQGLRGNGLISVVNKYLAKRDLNHWIIMEAVNLSGYKGKIRHLLYKWLLKRYKKHVDCFLTIGERASQLLINNHVCRDQIFPFAYFIANPALSSNRYKRSENKVFKFLFVGRFITLKRLDLLMLALSYLNDCDFVLDVVGSGPLEDTLYTLATKSIPGRFNWLGKLEMSQVPLVMNQVDCLVLPSNYDGWGAVVSEALLSGTQVICSDECGAASAVQASGFGGVFQSENMGSLIDWLKSMIEKGTLTGEYRQRIVNWADNSLGEKAGARYFDGIMKYKQTKQDKPLPPWEKSNN